MAQNTGSKDAQTSLGNRRESDEELMLQFQQGKEEAYTTLVNRFYEPLRFFVNGFMKNYDATDDVLQNTFLRLFIKREQYNGQAKLKTWLYMIAKNQALSALYQEGRWVHPETFEDGSESGIEYFVEGITPEDLASRVNIRELVDKAMSRINPAFAQAIYLHYFEQYSYEEIAAILNLNLNTVRTRIYRGKLELEKLLKGIRPDPDSR